MVIAYCDKCKKEIDVWNVKIISTKWQDDKGSQIAEICDDCLNKVITFIKERESI